MIKTAIYMRVSTDQQAREGESIHAQREALLKYISQHPDMVLVGEYMDDGVSGQKSNRDELQRLLEDVKGKKIDLILFTKLDRWFRSVRHYSATQELLEKYNVTWTAIFEPIYDTTSQSGRLVAHLMMSISQFEAENTAQRIKSVFDYKVSKGEVLSGKQPFGYSIVDKHLVPNEDAVKVKKIFDYFAMTGKLRETGRYAVSLGYDHEIECIKNMLSNEKYTGKFRGNPNYCPAIITTEKFEQVQRSLDMIVKSNARHEYIFSGLIICPECGKRMSGLRIYTYNYEDWRHRDKVRFITKKESGYGCYNARKGKCSNKSKVLERKIEDFLLVNLKDIVLRYEIKEKPKDNSKKISSLSQKIDRLKTLYIGGYISLDEYVSDRQDLEGQIAALSEDQPQDISKIKSLLGNTFGELYATMNNTEKRFLWRSVIKTITPHRVKKGYRAIDCDIEFL